MKMKLIAVFFVTLGIIILAVGACHTSYMKGYYAGKRETTVDDLAEKVKIAERQHEQIANAVRRLDVRQEMYLSGALFGHFAARQSMSWNETSNTIVTSWGLSGR